LKKPFLILLTFLLYFVVYIAAAILFGRNKDLESIVLSALVSNIAWHISFYCILALLRKNTKDNTEYESPPERCFN